MVEVERLAREKGCVGIYLDTFEEGAARVYERLGFSALRADREFSTGRGAVFFGEAVLARDEFDWIYSSQTRVRQFRVAAALT